MTTWLIRFDSSGPGPLVAVKDCFDVAGVPTTVGCPAISDDAEPARSDATVVARARAAGARLAGKTNLTELCRSADGVNPWTGTPVNPLDASRVPGGSSSGSAVAVACGEVDVGYGSDSGGSIRVPAACCGIAGLKTTLGRIPREGAFPLAESLDTVGPLARNVAGVAAAMRLMEPGFTVPRYDGPLTVARIRPAGVAAASEIDTAVDNTLRAAGFQIEEAPISDWVEATKAANTIMLAEGYAAHRHLLPRAERMTYRTRRRIERGAEVTEEQLTAARATGRAFRAELDALLKSHAALALPTLPTDPPRLDDVNDISLTSLTIPMNLAGLPALSLPVPKRGLPCSIQLVGPASGEERLLALGAMLDG